MKSEQRIVLITGSTDGVGRRTAQRMAAHGTKLLIHGRDEARARSVMQCIRAAGGEAVFYAADFSSLAQVRMLAEQVARDHGHLDVLINNAGIGTGGRAGFRQVSRDGHEVRFAVNYLAGFLLTRLLLPLLARPPGARIVNVASAGQEAIVFDDVMLELGYSGARAYCQSKLAQIMDTFSLARSLSGTGITVNCLHPASYMDTAMVRGDSIAPWSSVDEGADAILRLALSSSVARKTGLYFDGVNASRAHAQAYDHEARERLRLLSQDWVGLPRRLTSPPRARAIRRRSARQESR